MTAWVLYAFLMVSGEPVDIVNEETHLPHYLTPHASASDCSKLLEKESDRLQAEKPRTWRYLVCEPIHLADLRAARQEHIDKFRYVLLADD